MVAKKKAKKREPNRLDNAVGDVLATFTPAELRARQILLDFRTFSELSYALIKVPVRLSTKERRAIVRDHEAICKTLQRIQKNLKKCLAKDPPA